MTKKYYNVEARKDTARFPKKKASEKRQGGTIEGWDIVNFRGDPDSKVVVGHVKNDGVWGDEPYLRTSLIVSIDTDKKVLETLNTIYTLGEHYAPKP